MPGLGVIAVVRGPYIPTTTSSTRSSSMYGCLRSILGQVEFNKDDRSQLVSCRPR